MKKLIYLAIKDQTATLKRDPSMSTDFWNGNVVSWWGDVSSYSDGDEIRIPLGAFLVRKEWFRTNWGPLGGELHIDESSKELLKKGRQEFDEFKVRVAGRWSGPGDDILMSYKRDLTPAQSENLNHLMSIRSGANFSVPGAGKTTTTLVLWNELKYRGLVDRLLVICPRSAFEAWLSEPAEVFDRSIVTSLFDDEGICGDVEILITNYERLESEKRLNQLIKWAGNKNTHLVLDEAHRIKGGAASIRWQRCKMLATYVKRIDLLTGTPMPQGYDDLRNLLAISWPNVPRSFLTEDTLAMLGAGKVFVRTTKESLGLPPASVSFHRIQMGHVQKDIYSALRKNYAGIFRMNDEQEAYFGAKGRAVMSLLAAATNPGLLVGISKEDAYLGLEWPPRSLNRNSSLFDLVENYASHEIPPKYKWVLAFVEKASVSGKKVLIWSNFVGNIRALAKLLDGYSPAVIFGAVDQKTRSSELARFRNTKSCSVLITNPQTLGEGVSLHKDCHDAIYIDRSYNAGQYLQSLDRIHRLGLPDWQETNIHILSSVASIDERVNVRLEQKIDRLADALDDPGLIRFSLPDEGEQLPHEVLGADDLDFDDLLSHLGA